MFEALSKQERSDWSGRGDSNSRPPAPKAGALPGCATPRHELRQDYKGLPNRTVAPSDRSRPQVSCGIVRCEKIAKRLPRDSPEFLSRFHGGIRAESRRFPLRDRKSND